MGIFKKKTLATEGFRTRKDAFESMLLYLIDEKGIDPMEASKQADEFATIFAKNMGLPEKIEPEKKGVESWLQNIQKTTIWIKENPEVVAIGKPILLGAFSAIAGVFTGSKIEQEKEEQKYETVNFEDNGKMEWEANNDMGAL